MAESDWDDAWIFLSIARSDGGPLHHFFAAADHIGIAIPTDQELESAIRRLAANDLVATTGGSFALTAKGRDLFERGGGTSAYPRPQLTPIQPLLREALQSEKAQSAWHVDPGETLAARQQYAKSSKAASKELTKALLSAPADSKLGEIAAAMRLKRRRDK